MKPDGFDLGKRLREIREAQGLSQRELARRANVTNGAISLIEKNKSSPSVASLKRVLDAIPLSLGDFFSVDKTPDNKFFFKSDELQVLVEGDIRFRSVGDNSGKRQIQIMHEAYNPGADTGKSMLTHDAEEGGIVLKGQIEITVGDQVSVLGPGEAYYFDSRLPHRFRNVGKDQCEIISACTPPYL